MAELIDKGVLDSLHKKILKNSKMCEAITEKEMDALIKAKCLSTEAEIRNKELNEFANWVYEEHGKDLTDYVEWYIAEQLKAIGNSEQWNNGWIPVKCGEADIEPTEDGEIWVTRTDCFGDVWVQKCPYYVGDGFWDGVIAWKPIEKQPEPYQKGE